MTTITILKKSIKDDLIIISRKDLRDLLSVARKSTKTDKGDLIIRAIEAKAGKNISAPFSNTKDLFASLGI